MYIPDVPKDTEPILRSNLIETPIELSLSLLFVKSLTVLMKGPLYLTANDKLLAYGRSESEIYSLTSVNNEKPRTSIGPKPDFRVSSKWFIRNVVPWVGHNKFFHPLQSLFL